MRLSFCCFLPFLSSVAPRGKSYRHWSDFGVAVWGKDFDPEEHEKAVQRAREGRYFPTVDVFLPVCNEPIHLLANTWKHVGSMDYPYSTVHVLDDGGKEEVRQLAALHGFNCE